MQLTRASEYGFRSIRFLAGMPKQGKYSIHEIAQHEKVPTYFLAKVMQKLTQAKIVKSFQGKKGGYGLVRSPDQISLKELLAAVEGKFFINRCLQFPENCIFVKDCKMHEVWQKVQNEMCSILERYHISDFI